MELEKEERELNRINEMLCNCYSNYHAGFAKSVTPLGQNRYSAMKKLLAIFFISFFLHDYLYAQKYKWKEISPGISCTGLTSDCYVTGLLFDSIYNQLYVCGSFDSMAHIAGMARFDRITWKDIYGLPFQGRGMQGRGMKRYKDKVAVFKNREIFVFDSLTAFDIGIANDDVTCMEVYNGELYVGGDFSKINNQKFNHIARWDGVQWKDVSGGVQRTDLSGTSVAALKQFNGKLYVGGAFDSVGNVIKSWNIASWDGSNWSTVGGIGASLSIAAYPYLAWISAFGIYKNQLYMAGGFDYLNGVKINGLARTSDGVNWYSVNNYAHNYIICMKEWDNKLFFGLAGSFYLYQYDGANFSIPADTIYGSVSCLEVFQDELYAGGQFYYAGDSPLFKIGKLVKDTTVNVTEIEKKEGLLKMYPNPSDGSFAIVIQNNSEKQSTYTLRVTDFIGRTYLEKRSNIGAKGSVTVPANIDLPQGIYLVDVYIGNERHLLRFIIIPQ